MISGLSISGPLKSVYRNNCQQISPAKAVNNLYIDPKETGMDALVLQPKDITGFNVKNLVGAINDRHPDIKVIYIYAKESDASKLSNVDKYHIPKMTPEELKNAVDKSLADKVISENNVIIASNDKKVLTGKRASHKMGSKVDRLQDNVEKLDEDKNELSLESEGEQEGIEVIDLEDEESNPITLDDEQIGDPKLKELFDLSEGIPRTSPAEKSFEYKAEDKPLTIEQQISKIVDLTDWNALQEYCNLERIKIDLMNDSSQYAGCINFMNTLEQSVDSALNNPKLKPDEKMLKIRELGIEKSGVKAQANNILVTKYVSILDKLTDLITRETTRQMTDFKDKLNKLVVKQDFFSNEDDVRELIDQRLKIQLLIGTTMSGIINTYKVMHQTANDIISKMDEDLPTENKYVNEILKPYASYFKPENAGKLFLELTSAVDEKRLVLSSIEDKLQAIFTAVFKLVEIDSEIIANYQHKLDIFKAQNTEEVIVMTTMLKSALRLYIASKNVGLTTTSLMASGCLARRRNTIHLDLRKENRLAMYEDLVTPLDDLLRTNVERDLVICQESVTDVDRLEYILKSLNDKLYYYHNINIVLDEDQIDFIERLGKELRTIVIVTSCTPKALLDTKDLVSKINVENVAQKLVEIAPPIDPVKIAVELGIDVTKCQITTIPYSLDVARCTAEGHVPYEKPELRTIYEKGMRI